MGDIPTFIARGRNTGTEPTKPLAGIAKADLPGILLSTARTVYAAHYPCSELAEALALYQAAYWVSIVCAQQDQALIAQDFGVSEQALASAIVTGRREAIGGELMPFSNAYDEWLQALASLRNVQV